MVATKCIKSGNKIIKIKHIQIINEIIKGVTTKLIND